MIGKLRRRIIAINLVSMGLVLLISIVLIFAVGYSRINAERENRLNFALSYDPLSDGAFEENSVFNDVALIYYDTEQQKITATYMGNRFTADEKSLEEIVLQVVSSKRNKGLLHAHILYMKQVDNSIVKVAVNNYSTQSSTIAPYFVTTLGILVLGLCTYFFISWMLACTALKPVEESWKRQHQFVADASHELKTPLSVILANTDMIASHKDETVESQMKWIENTQAEAARMADLVADLLFLAKNDDGVKVSTENINISDCVSSVVLGYDAIFYENKKTVQYDIQQDLHIDGNVGQLKQLVTILLDNANRYSLECGNINLTLAANGKYAQLSVANDCEQLTSEQLEHLFDRFYTVDPSRNKNNGGNGLGLAIAQTICQTNGGNIRVNCVDGRITFTATFLLKRHNAK